MVETFQTQNAEPGRVTHEFPLSFAQRRLWFMHQMEPESALYNMPFSLRLSGELDVKALRRTLSEIVRRHEILRTTFNVRGEEPVQQVHEATPVRFPIVDISGLDQSDRESVAREIRQLEFSRAFNLESGPLLRARLVRLAANEFELLWIVHHIISDGWSEGVLVKELEVLYRAFHEGQPSPLSELAIQYADYALWEKEWLQGERLEEQMQYWRRKLAGLSILDLPKDRPRPEHALHSGESLPLKFTAEFTGKAKALAQSEGATLFMVLLAAFQLLLSRYSGQKDIAVGTLVANRKQTEAEELIGFFVNTLVLRTDLSSALTFRSLLRRVQTVTLEAYGNQDVPLEKLAEELKPERFSGSVPFIQAGLVFQNMPTRDLDLPGVSFRTVSTDYAYSFVDVGLSINEESGGLSGMMMYSTEIFNRSTMQGFINHYKQLLHEAVHNPDMNIWDLCFMTYDERRFFISEWNRTESHPLDTRPVHELVEMQAAKAPGAPAIVCDSTAVAYGELNERANQLAHLLAERGIGAESRVGICLERTPEIVVAMLGILKAGAAYVPVDPLHPIERLDFILADAGVSALLTTAKWAGQFAGARFPVIVLDRCEGLEDKAKANLSRHVLPCHAAYLIYTSGSTGNPKGVVVQHGGLTNVITASIKILDLSADSRVSQLASPTFDASVAEIFSPLCSGGTVCIIGPERMASIPEFVDALSQARISVLGCVPSILGLIAPEALPALKIVIVGGESCPRDTADRWLGKTRFLNAYAPTEASIYSTLSECKPEECREGLPFGRPIPNARMYILDDNMIPVPAGLVGEIYIGGTGVSRGYWLRPELTAERFLPDPFGQEPGIRLYKTGDLGRFREDGNIDFLGRVDDQVKIRGHRIELGEIENVLQHAPSVTNCAVMVRDDCGQEKRLVAYFTFEGEGTASRHAVREHLRRKLPAYMVPAAFVMLKSLPLTPNGKIDRKALPCPELEQEDSYVAPRTSVEELLANIWQEILRVQQVGIHDNFFDLGGHSLLAMQIVTRIRNAGFEVPLAKIFSAPSVAQLADIIQASDALRDTPAVPAIKPRKQRATAPLSFAQQQIWFTSQMDQAQEIYNIPLVLKLMGELHVPVLHRVFNEIVRRHEIARTVFPVENGRPVQVVSPVSQIELDIVDLNELLPERRKVEVQRLVDEQVAKRFDLERGPLLRVGLYATGRAEFVLVIVVHHIICDAVSLRVFLQEIAVLYSAFLRGQVSPLPELSLQYGDYAAWENGWLSEGVLARHLEYWLGTLHGCSPVLMLPTDFPRSQQKSYSAGRERVHIGKAEIDGIRHLARQHAATEFMTLLALLELWLSYHSGQNDILIGSPVSNRSQIQTEPLMGFFVNTLVFRARVNPDSSFSDFLEQVRTTAVEGYNYRAMPIEKLVKALNLSREPGRNPLYQVLFNMVNEIDQEVAMEGLEISEGGTGVCRTEFDLQIAVSLAADGADVFCTYASDLFRPETIVSMLESFVELAKVTTASPGARIQELLEQVRTVEAKSELRQKRADSEKRFQKLASTRRRSNAASVQ
jgi:amino acid adenylation domain-containing protein